jgi:Putative zinc- or iron-chelating domain
MTDASKLFAPTGESCGSCSLCCKILHIDADTLYDEDPRTLKNEGMEFPEKPWNTWCEFCEPGNPHPCQVYERRPQACKTYECLWLQSQRRDDVPALPSAMKPNMCHVVLNGSHLDDSVLYAYVDVAYLGAWRKEPVRSHLIKVAQQGLYVVIVEGKKRFIMTKDSPTVELSEGQIMALGEGKYVRMNEEGTLQIGVPSH